MAITRIGNPAIADQRGVNFRNIIINGDMSIAQRGTSATNVSSGYHTCDRWKFDRGVGTVTVSQETDAPTGSGFVKSFKVLETASSSPSAGDTNLLQHLIEGQNLQYLKKGTSSAEPLTASFWVKGNLTGTYILELRDRDNSRQVSKSYTISSANTWEYKTISFPADTTGTLDNDNATSLQFNFWVSAGSNFTSGTLNTTWNSETAANRAVGQVNLNGTTNSYIQWTGVQLEAGQVASDFEFLPHDVNLNKCLRYFEKIADGSEDADGVIGSGGYVYQPDVLGVNYQWYPKRTTPSIYQSSGTNYFRFQRDGGTEDFNSIKIYIPNYLNGLIYSDDGFTGADDEKGWVQINSSSAYLGLNAEL